MRRVAAALLAALTVGLAVHLAVSRPAPDEVKALVATRPVPLGQVVSAGDVELRHLPPRALPAGALTSAEPALGRTAAVPLVEGRVLVSDDLSTAGLLQGLPEHLAAVYLPLSEPEVPAALGAADRVDVHSPVDGSVVVAAALVLRASAGERPGVWLAVDPAGAEALAAARGADPAGAALQLTLSHPQG